MEISLIYAPGERELKLFKQAIWTTMGKRGTPKTPPSEELLHSVLNAKHSPCRVLNFCFLLKDIPSNTATHFVRHVHSVPFVSSLRNDRQEKIDGDLAPRNTPVDMMFYVNAEELMTIANKRLCMMAAQKTREATKRMCELAEEAMPALHGLLVPICEYNNGVCHEVTGCGKHPKK